MTLNLAKIQEHRRAEHNRRQVRTRNIRQIGQYQRVQHTRSSKRTVKRTAATAGALGALFALLEVIGTTTAALVAAAGSTGVAYLEYRRDLIEVKRTGKPIQDPAVKPAPKPAEAATSKPVPAAQPKAAKPCGNCGGKGTVTANLKGGRTQEFHCPSCSSGANFGKPVQGKAIQGKAMRRHADGTVCTAKSEATCRKGGARKRRPSK